ncbi:MAG: peptidylprolyl isomerase [Peptoniphilus sp.]|nr:peptidylprolyl isomerase [Peptoniphilus sp.]MDD7362791.1 peptidylprolyl isomerase [Bacillota bacterium]MDY6044017.1 peptidylprolyl isomerase [Peptoniphilus sp.]
MNISKSLKKIGVVALAASVMLVGCGKNSGNAAATVNGKDIPRVQYEKEYKVQAQQAMAQFGKDFLEQSAQDGSNKTMGELMRENTLENLIGLEVVKQDAEKKGITVSDKEVDSELDKMKQMYGGEEQFNEILKSNNMDLNELKDYTKTNLLMQKYQKKMLKDLEPKEEEIKEYYEKNKDRYKTAEASHILVKTKEEAEAVKKELDGGADFAKLAKEKSIDKQSAENGGSLGEFTPGQMVKEFDDKVFSMKPGEISDPVKTQFGYHIIKLEKINDDFDSAKENVKMQMIQERFQEHTKKLRSDAKVKRHVDTSEDIAVEPIKEEPKQGDAKDKKGANNAQSSNQAQSKDKKTDKEDK